MITAFNPIIIPPTIATEVKIADTLVRAGNDLLNKCVAAYTQQYNAVWTPSGTTPDKVIAAFGTQAVQVFTRAAALAAFLVAQGAVVPTTSPAGWTVTFNADGSATATRTTPA